MTFNTYMGNTYKTIDIRHFYPRSEFKTDYLGNLKD